MNDEFGWQIKNRVWLSFAAAVFVSALGCGGPGQEALQQQADPVSSDQENLVLVEFTPVPSQLRELIDESRQAFEQGSLDEAIEKCTIVLRHSWSNTVGSNDVRAVKAEVLHLRGQAFLAKGFPQIAIDDLDDAIRFGEDELDAKAYVLRAKAASSLRRWSQAAADCTSSIRLYPDNAEAFLIRGRALEAMGKSSRAEESLLEAQRLGIVFQTTFKPTIESVPSVLDQAKLFMDAGSPSVACEILEKAILDGNDSWETSGLIARARYQLQQFDLAIGASTRALGLNPQYADAYRIRGLSHLQRKSFDQAITDLNAAIALDASLAEQLNPALLVARRRGGIDPVIRSAVTSRIRELVAADSKVDIRPGQSERWLLELIAQQKSSDQIDQFKTLLATTPEAEIDSLDWLADFLMMGYRVPAVNELRNYLDRKSPDVSAVEKRLWEKVKTRVTAASHGVNVFPNLAAYAIEYGYLKLLQTSTDSEICDIKFVQVYQSIEKESSDCLKLILPHANLLSHEIRGLLRYCIEKQRKNHIMLIINQYESNLTWEIIQLLEMAE